LGTLTKAVIELAGASVRLVNDPKMLTRLQPLFVELGKLPKIFAERRTVAQNGLRETDDDMPSTSELHDMVREITETLEERELDRARPVHIKIIDKRGKDE